MAEAAKAGVETIVRSRYCGLRDIYIATLTQNTQTAYAADVPVKLARAINAKISDKWSSEKVYSDDGTEDTITSYEGTEVEIEVSTLAPQDRALLFGQLYDKGFLVKSKDDLAPELALGFRTKRRNGKYEFTWLYCGKFGQGVDDEFETQAEKVAVKSNTIKGDFYDRQKDGQYQIVVDEGNLLEEHADAKAAIADWFSKVQEKEQAAG